MSGISLSGIASGMKTDEMIESLMKLEKIPYNNLETKKSALSSNQTQIRNLNTSLLALRNAATELMYTTAYNQTSAKVSDNTVISVSSTDTALAGSYNVEVTQLAKKHVVTSAEFTAAATSTLSGSFKLSGKGGTISKDITISSTPPKTNKEMLDQLSKDINAAKAGVTASVIETSPGKLSLVLTSDEFGEASDMNIGTSTGSTGDQVYFGGDQSSLVLLRDLGIKKPGVNETNTKQEAQNAVVKVNGISIISGSNQLKDVVPGTTINLLKEGASSTISIDKDVDKVAEKIQTFVTAYNDAVTLVRSNSAKGAPMQGDSTLRMLQTELNDLVNGFVGGTPGSKNADYTGAFQMLSDLGLEVDKGITSGSLMTGKLSFDQDKFKSAYNSDPESVYKIFGYDGTNNKDAGIAVRIFTSINNWTKSNTGLLAHKLSGYDSEIKMITQQMTDMNARLDLKQKLLEKQFAAMEKALSSLQSQQTWLSNELSSWS
jgi:flagellar hook-associated protein 2